LIVYVIACLMPFIWLPVFALLLAVIMQIVLLVSPVDNVFFLFVKWFTCFSFGYTLRFVGNYF